MEDARAFYNTVGSAVPAAAAAAAAGVWNLMYVCRAASARDLCRSNSAGSVKWKVGIISIVGASK